MRTYSTMTVDTQQVIEITEVDKAKKAEASIQAVEGEDSRRGDKEGVPTPSNSTSSPFPIEV